MGETSEQHNEQRIVCELGWDSETEIEPSYAVISAVANAEGGDAMALPPLNNAIDPDVLDRLISPDADNGAEQVVFRYCGYRIRVSEVGLQLQE